MRGRASPNRTGSSTRNGIDRGVGFGLQRLSLARLVVLQKCMAAVLMGAASSTDLMQCKADARTRAVDRFDREPGSPKVFGQGAKWV